MKICVNIAVFAPHPRHGNIPTQHWLSLPNAGLPRNSVQTSDSPHSDGEPSNAVRRSRRRRFYPLRVMAQALPIDLFGAWRLSQSNGLWRAAPFARPQTERIRNTAYDRVAPVFVKVRYIRD